MSSAVRVLFGGEDGDLEGDDGATGINVVEDCTTMLVMVKTLNTWMHFTFSRH